MINNDGSGDATTCNNFLQNSSIVQTHQRAVHDNHYHPSSKRSSDGPLAVFTPCSNSHPFEERRIQVTRSEEQAVKIGRAVVRFQPSPNNALFDCKVLSRNHAVLWYKDNQFFIKDTRSSNGTFLNNERLSNSGEESMAHALYSGDILQLGVEIVDNTKKVASGCVMCIVSLYNDHGEECCRPALSMSNSTASNENFENGTGNSLSIEKLLADNEALSLKYTTVPNDKLFIMDQYLKEARFRENLLGQKLQSLEEQLAGAQEALESSWQALINEEHLLSRIEILESQLALYVANNKNNNSKDKDKAKTKEKLVNDSSQSNSHEDLIRGEIREIHEDHARSEQAAKDALRKTEEQMFETNMRLHDAENGLFNLEEENSFLRQQCHDFENELSRRRVESDELISELAKRCAESGELQTELGQSRANYSELVTELEQRRAECTELRERVSQLEMQGSEPKINSAQTKDTHQTESQSFVIGTSPESILQVPENGTSSKDDLPLKNGNCGNKDFKPSPEKCLIPDHVKSKGVTNCNNKINNCDAIDVEVEPGSDNIAADSSFINEEKNDVNRNCCVCGRILEQNEFEQRRRAGVDVQILLLSMVPLFIVVIALLFPIFSLWSVKNVSDVLPLTDKLEESSPQPSSVNELNEKSINECTDLRAID